MSKRILVVDDDGLILKSVSKVLSRGGYEVLTAGDVESAMRYIDTAPIDAALVDYDLSRETGISILAYLLNFQPNCVRILFTGKSDSSIVVDAVNHSQVNLVIPKHQNHDLLRKLEDALDLAQQNLQIKTEAARAQSSAERIALEETLRDQRLSLALQPIYDAGKGSPRPFAFEALLRPKHTRINNPKELLDLAERYDRIIDVGSSVFRMARLVLAQLPPQYLLFVNLHPQQLGRPDRLAQDLAAFDGQGGRIVIEITEQSQLQRYSRWEESIKIISDAGCAIAVDDLGAGYSSLVILADLKPAYIKLDMSLVRNIHQMTRKQRLVTLIRLFGDATDAKTIAEGVESEEELRALLDCGIRYLQGFHFARPSERFIGERFA